MLPGWSRNPGWGFRVFLSRIRLLYLARGCQPHRETLKLDQAASDQSLAVRYLQDHHIAEPPVSSCISELVTGRWRWMVSPCHPVALLPSAYFMFPSCYIGAQLASLVSLDCETIRKHTFCTYKFLSYLTWCIHMLHFPSWEAIHLTLVRS